MAALSAIWKAAICGLIQHGFSQRQVHRLLRIDRGAIARAVQENHQVPCVQIVRRCPMCGALVVWPCRACQLRLNRLRKRRESWIGKSF